MKSHSRYFGHRFLLSFILFLLFNDHLHSQIVITNQNLPFEIEGYTTSEGNNIHYNGGIQIEMDLVEEIHGTYIRRQRALKVGTPYLIRLKVLNGRSFEDGNRMPENLHGPGSQVIIHLPASAAVNDSPIIIVDGRTVSQQLMHSLWSIAGFSIPQASGVGSFFSSLILDEIAKAIGDRVIDASYSNFRTSRKIQVSDNMGFRTNQQVRQISWQLGGWQYRDHLDIKNAEIQIPVIFTEKGDYDLSFFSNIWGRHTYANRRNLFTATTRGVFHSFRQHIVIKVSVQD